MAASLQACRVASSAAACRGVGRSLTRTTSFMAMNVHTCTGSHHAFPCPHPNERPVPVPRPRRQARPGSAGKPPGRFAALPPPARFRGAPHRPTQNATTYLLPVAVEESWVFAWTTVACSASKSCTRSSVVRPNGALNRLVSVRYFHADEYCASERLNGRGRSPRLAPSGSGLPQRAVGAVRVVDLHEELRCGSHSEFCTAAFSCAALPSYSFAVAVSVFIVAILLMAWVTANMYALIVGR